MNPDEFVNALFDDIERAASITVPVLVIRGQHYTPEQVSQLDMTTFTDDELETIAGFQRTHDRQYIVMEYCPDIHALAPADWVIIRIVREDPPLGETPLPSMGINCDD